MVASLLPQALFVVIRQVQFINDVMVDVFPPQHMTYLLMYSVPHSVNACIIVIVNPFLRPPLSSNLRTKSDLTVNAADEVENMLSGTVLLVVDDHQHVSRMKVSLLYYTCEECRTTGSAGAYVAHPLDEEGSSVARTYQPIDALKYAARVSPSPQIVDS
jgi:hypothetical protein